MKRDDPMLMRQPPSPYDRDLNHCAIGWLKELPLEVVPVALAAKFPRIVNRLARFWDSPAMIKQCFADLLVHRRPGRSGFPGEVLNELFALDQYYHELHKTEEPGSLPASRDSSSALPADTTAHRMEVIDLSTSRAER